MARRRYYRRAIRVVPRKKWASNYKTFALQTPNTTYIVLAENKTQPDAPTPVILKTGNFKVQGDCQVTNASSSGSTVYVRAFILFVPEGWATANIGTIPTDHPEWIMAWTVVDMPYANTTTTTAGNKFSMSSRLKRNLNSGDKVVIYLDGPDTEYPIARIVGSAQYWTCAN